MGHQCSFSNIPLFFHQNVQLPFYWKQMLCFKKLEQNWQWKRWRNTSMIETKNIMLKTGVIYISEYVLVIYSIKNWINSSGTWLTCCFIFKLKITFIYMLPFAFFGCTTRSHSLSLIAICCCLLLFAVTFCHSLSLIVPLAITCYHLLYHSLLSLVTLFHTLSLFVPLVCLFITDWHFQLFANNELMHLDTFMFSL